MSVRDVFGLAVRLAGLAMIFFSLFDLVHVLMDAIGLPISQQYSIGAAFVGALVWAAFGFGTFLGANVLTRMAYGDHD